MVGGGAWFGKRMLGRLTRHPLAVARLVHDVEVHVDAAAERNALEEGFAACVQIVPRQGFARCGAQCFRGGIRRVCANLPRQGFARWIVAGHLPFTSSLSVSLSQSSTRRQSIFSVAKHKFSIRFFEFENFFNDDIQF